MLHANGSTAYCHDCFGQLTRKVQTVNGVASTLRYAYTKSGRLAALDATGNRTALTTATGTTSYTYPADSHRLIGVDGEARNHDAAGNTISIGGREFSYSDVNRMNAVKQAGAVVESYTYNHPGDRVLRVPASGEAQLTVQFAKCWRAGSGVHPAGSPGHPARGYRPDARYGDLGVEQQERGVWQSGAQCRS